ncbi:hypothetical protein [Streptomyces sp. NBC_00564]|uniref:hypothetical protein n=1 Tax=Streptomyces sp. NBC_00564 TaxID=2903663 RepID=UPI00352C821B|nr:hypothetical protein OG256_21845 [Streptomyces sp. NBC_00564]
MGDKAKKVSAWLEGREKTLRESLVSPSPRKMRLYLWSIGVTLFSFMAVCWPLITGSGTKTPANIFGGVEFILAGIVIMVGGMTDLISAKSEIRPRARSLTFMVSVLLGSASLGFTSRLSDESHVPSAGYIAMTVTLFVLTVLCGTFAVWLAEEGD